MSVLLAQALLHSLWQIGGVALLLWLALKLTPKENSNLRYILSLICLYATPVIFIATCIILSNLKAVEYVTFSTASRPSDFAIIIVWVWVFGAMVLGFKFFQDGNDLHRLLEKPMQSPPSDIQERFAILLDRFAVGRSVGLFISDYVTSACTSAYWKPIILIPPAYLSKLSFDEIEAIIAHELAHIKRNDGFHRITQLIIDTAFYFHPCYNWISRQVSTEREHACDDLAVALIAKKKSLATALLKANLLQAENRLLLAAQSPSYQALDCRIRRLLPLKSSVTSRARRTIAPYVAALCFMIVGCGALIVPSWSIASDKLTLKFSRTTLVNLKNEVCDHMIANDLYWTQPFEQRGPATIHIRNETIFMNGHKLPSEDQRALKRVFENYNLSSFADVKLRYYGNDVKLMLS